MKQIIGRAFFNITDPDQKVGATISDLATFMVPVGPEAGARIEIAEGAVDLAIPGSEEGTRIPKQAGEGSFVQHFADESEAKRVADSLKDEGWAAENCGPCKFPQVMPQGLVATSSLKRRSLRPIQQRGNVLGPCRNVPSAGVLQSEFGDFDSPSEDALFPESEASPDVAGNDDAGDERLHELGHIMISFNPRWERTTDPALKPFQDLTSAALEHGKNIVAKVKGLSADQISRLQGSVEYFWTVPSPEALKGVDPRGLHVDKGRMQFGASDTEGLIVQDFNTKQFSRVPVTKNAFQCLKAISWDSEAFINKAVNGPTAHTVFRPEMAEKGRVSVIMMMAFA